MEMKEPTSGGMKEKKMPSVLRVKHADMPEAENMAPGDEVEMHGKGHVVSNRAKDEFGDGEAEIHMHSIEHHETKKKGRDKSKNAAHMPVDELKEVIKASEPKDKEY